MREGGREGRTEERMGWRDGWEGCDEVGAYMACA